MNDRRETGGRCCVRLGDLVCTVKFTDKEEAQTDFDSSLATLEALYDELDNLSVEAAFEGFEQAKGEEPLKDSALGAFVKYTDVEAADGYILPGERRSP